MAVLVIQDQTNPFATGDPVEFSTEDAGDVGLRSAEEVIERVNEILGYDIFQTALMIEGYQELGSEMLSISESSLAAQVEVLPDE